jgi:tetratricopeptide (TPR) repeat protein
VRRNRGPVLGTAALLITLASFAIVTALDNQTIQKQLTTIQAQNEIIRQERDVAQNQSAVAAQVVEFLSSLYEMAAPDPNRSETLRARELLDRVACRIERELQDAPLQRAALQTAMGRAYIALGLYNDAEPLLVAAEKIFAELRQDQVAHRNAQFWLAGLRLKQGDLRTGEQLLRQSWQPAAGELALNPITVAARHSALAGYLRDAGRYDEALQLVADARRIAGDQSDAVARAGIDLDVVEASILRDQGQFERARDLTTNGINHAEQRDGKGHGRHANIYRELGQIHLALGDLDQANLALQQALSIDRKLSGEEHPDVDTSLFAVAMNAVDRGQWQEAAELLREVLQRDERRFGKRHPYSALSRSQLATVLGNLGQTEQAEPMFQEALALQRELLPEGHPELATTIANLGSFYNRLRRFDEAAPCFEEALALRLRIHEPEHPTVLTARQQLAVLELGRGNAAAAETQFRTILKQRRKVRGEHSETAGSLLSLATCIARQGRPDEAIPMFQESTAMFRKTLPAGHETIARPMLGEALAHMRRDAGPSPEAEALLRDAEALRVAALGEEHFRTLYTRYWLIRCLIQNQNPEAALPLAKATVTLLRKHFPDDQLCKEAERLLAALQR